ncbi:uncharacterized protein [Temnothorax longispinosus]|uniref:uncharacterized protein n=1 Tax=Temnothorax longispinosus TaxID=300112 RepID=UPI003A994341
MYRQILVAKPDRVFQRILWRRSPSELIMLCELNTVTYGQAGAVFLTISCLRKLAAEAKDLPLAAKALEEETYMDDAATSKQELTHWKNEVCKIDKLLVLDKERAQKTLGLLWNTAEDCLQYKVEIEETKVTTKRTLFSKISQVFDPLGLITPLLINGKCIMQRLWLFEIGWNQTLPPEFLSTWEKYYTSLPRVNELRIPRNVIPANSSEKFDIFKFGDASEKAYGACLYAVSIDKSGKVQSHLICAKSKVAPLKTISLPRLELEAALLLSNPYHTAEKAYGDRIRRVRLWSDNTIALGWINTPPNVLKTFVAYRKFNC